MPKRICISEPGQLVCRFKEIRGFLEAVEVVCVYTKSTLDQVGMPSDSTKVSSCAMLL